MTELLETLPVRILVHEKAKYAQRFYYVKEQFLMGVLTAEELKFEEQRIKDHMNVLEAAISKLTEPVEKEAHNGK